jgi:hypothetical protein
MAHRRRQIGCGCQVLSLHRRAWNISSHSIGAGNHLQQCLPTALTFCYTSKFIAKGFGPGTMSVCSLRCLWSGPAQKDTDHRGVQGTLLIGFLHYKQSSHTQLPGNNLGWNAIMAALEIVTSQSGQLHMQFACALHPAITSLHHCYFFSHTSDKEWWALH